MKYFFLMLFVALGAMTSAVQAQTQLGPADYIIYDQIVATPKTLKTVDGVQGYWAAASKFHKQDPIAVFVEKTKAEASNKLLKVGNVVPVSTIQNAKNAYIAVNVNDKGLTEKEFAKSEKAFDKQVAKAARQNNGAPTVGGQILRTGYNVAAGITTATTGIYVPPLGGNGGMNNGGYNNPGYQNQNVGPNTQQGPWQ